MAVRLPRNRYGLTNRQFEMLRLVSEGMKNKEIAEELCLSELVVKNYLRVVFDQLGVWTRLEAALWYVAHVG